MSTPAYRPVVGQLVRVHRYTQPTLDADDRERELTAEHLGQVVALHPHNVIELRVADSPGGPGLVRVGTDYVFLGQGQPFKRRYLVTHVTPVDMVALAAEVGELRARVTRLERTVALLNRYGEAMVGDQWWPGNATVYLTGAPGRELEELLG